MQAFWTFVKTTLVGGVLVLVPLYLVVLLLLKSLQGFVALVTPLLRLTPIDAKHHTLIALVLVLAASFLVGLALKTPAGRALGRHLNEKVLSHIPGYTLMRNITRHSFGDAQAEFDVALAEIEDALVPAYVIERHADGRFTVLVPSSPTPFTGSVYVLTPERVHLVDVPFVQAFQAVAKWGDGTRHLLAAMKCGKSASSPSPR